MPDDDLMGLGAELRELQRCFDRWRALPGNRRGGPTAQGLIEVPLREFFQRASPPGVRTGTGERPALDSRYGSDMDIVFDYEGDDWFAHVRMEAHQAPVLAHLDVAGRSSWDRDKLTEDLGRLQRSIDDGKAMGRKTWTGLVAVGSGFHHRAEEIMRVAHEVHHRVAVEQWASANAGSVWPFVDAVIIPGMLLKKHDLFVSRSLEADRHPVLYPFPVGGFAGLEELWPLVAGRAFLGAYLRRIVGEQPWEAPAWGHEEMALILGGASSEGAWPEPWRVVALRDNVPVELHHWTGNPSIPWQDHVRYSNDACSNGCSFPGQPRS